METWNREELYAEIWEKPMVKIANKYGISAVMLGKVCRKLQIPLPGRGYWVKKEFGKPVEQMPLPVVKDLPVVRRCKESPPRNVATQQAPSQAPEPTDQYYLSIREMESRTIAVNPDSKRHKLVVTAEKALRRGRADSRGILERDWQQPPCLDIRVTKQSLDRALAVANGIVCALEKENFPITVETGTLVPQD